ncbi:MAG TPA: efflux transporter outer membrane subunit [Tepidisphaeraceae bacterium]|jgi:NodT family efflux transporter outer membrane factor (OMF) lipoprotein|nr:efflux transporter outer membrane subunit [Tepidisphaeraceae bacterium]
MRKILSILIGVGMVAGGCEVGPNYTPPKVTVLRDWGERGMEPTTKPSATTQTSRTTSSMPIVDWWKTFHDPLLNDLVKRAVAENLDLKRATSRLREARAERGVVQADLYPEVDASGSYQHARVSKNGVASAFGGGGSGAVNAGGGGQSPPGANGSPAIPGSELSEFNLYQAGFDASWEIDVFGGKRRAVEAASAEIQAAVEDQRDVLTTLLAEVARNYLELREGQHRVAIAQKNLEAQQKTVELTRELARQGLTNELDLSRAQAQVATTASQVPGLETDVSQAIHRLSVLLGERPTALAEELTKEGDLPGVPDEVPVGLPSELLRRRLDVRRAERMIAVATARVGMATADLFPKFTLNGSVGLQSLQPGDLASWDSRFYSIGPGISWPIFDAGKIHNQIHVQEAREDQAILAYRQVVLTALKEVEDALVAYDKTQQRVAALRDAVEAERKAVRISNDLYKQGLTDFLSVLDAERTLYASEDGLAAGEGEIATSLVALYKALGGGWEIDRQNRSLTSQIEEVPARDLRAD